MSLFVRSVRNRDDKPSVILNFNLISLFHQVLVWFLRVAVTEHVYLVVRSVKNRDDVPSVTLVIPGATISA